MRDSGALLSATVLSLERSFLLLPRSLSYFHRPLHPPSHCCSSRSHAHCARTAPQNCRDPTQPQSATIMHPRHVLSFPTLPPCHATCPRLSTDHLHPSHVSRDPTASIPGLSPSSMLSPLPLSCPMACRRCVSHAPRPRVPCTHSPSLMEPGRVHTEQAHQGGHMRVQCRCHRGVVSTCPGACGAPRC